MEEGEKCLVDNIIAISCKLEMIAQFYYFMVDFCNNMWSTCISSLRKQGWTTIEGSNKKLK